MRPMFLKNRCFKIVLGISRFIALNVNAHWEFINTEKLLRLRSCITNMKGWRGEKKWYMI